MKRILSFLSILLALYIQGGTTAQTSREVSAIAKYEAIDGMLPTFQRIMQNEERLDKLCVSFEQVESGMNAKAYNKRENSVGILAIRPIMVREANRLLRLHDGIDYDYFTYDDRWDRSYAELIFAVVQIHKNPSLDLTKACVVWNCHGGQRYINKIKIAYKKTN